MRMIPVTDQAGRVPLNLKAERQLRRKFDGDIPRISRSATKPKSRKAIETADLNPGIPSSQGGATKPKSRKAIETLSRGKDFHLGVLSATKPKSRKAIETDTALEI